MENATILNFVFKNVMLIKTALLVAVHLVSVHQIASVKAEKLKMIIAMRKLNVKILHV